MAGRSFVLGPFRSRRIILPFKFTETTEWRAFFDCTHNKNIFCKVKVHANGQISVVIFNQSDTPQHVTSKMRLCCAKGNIDSITDVDGTEYPLKVKTKRVNNISVLTPVDKDATVARLREEFPLVFSDTIRPTTSRLWDIRVRDRDLCWQGEPKPCWRENYVSDLTNEEISKEIDSLHKEGVIRQLSVAEAIHAVVAPLNFIRKPNGKIRPTIDFRDINTYLEGTQGGTIIPVSNIIQKVDPKWTVYTIVDIVHGYGSIPIDDDISLFFALHWNGVTYGFRRLPQGVNVSPELFNNRMTHILQGLDVVRYFDDILIGGETEEELLDKTKLLLKRFDEYGLTINCQKCDWFETSVSFLGTELSGGTLNPYHRAQAILQKLPTITSRHDVQKAMGLCQQLAQYCYKYDAIVTQLKPFLKREHNDYTKADEIYKDAVQSLCISTYRLTLERREPFHLYTDWCGNPLNQFGYVLLNSTLQPVLFGSFTTKQRVGSFLGELMGIVRALKECYFVIKQTEVFVYSDNMATVNWLKEPTFLHKFKDLRIQRQHCWLRHHFSHDRLHFCFVEGKDNVIADLLSRWRDNAPVEFHTKKKQQGYQVNSISLTPEERTELIKKAHAGHFGVKKTFLNLRSDGTRWTNDFNDVRDYVNNCETCQMFRNPRSEVDLGMIDSPSPNHTLCLDFIGPLNRGSHGFRYIATGIDAFTKFGVGRLCKTCSAAQAIKLVLEWARKFGAPQRILCDNGSAFIARSFESTCTQHGIDILHTPAYSHKSAGTVEAFNRNLVNRLRRIWAERRGDWTTHVSTSVQEINRTIHSTTLFCPQYLLTGTQRDGTITSPQQLDTDRGLAYQRIIKAHQQNKTRHHKKVKNRPMEVGAEVSWYNTQLADRLDSKLYSKWVYPCVVVKKHSDHRWDIRMPNGSTLHNVHRDFLRRLDRR